MNAAVLLAACLLAPFYDQVVTPEGCDPALGPCWCTDVAWCPDPLATSFDVERMTVSSGTVIPVGTVHEVCDEDGRCDLPADWSTFRDPSPPHVGTAYRYRSRLCNVGGCSAWSEWVDDLGYPLCCFDGDPPREVSCYVGANCRIPAPRGCKP